jgi:MurNAc alpha-1-phosphate uridylyltransferase
MLTAVILAGGLAKRMRPLTDKIPKSLIEIQGLPFVYWQLKLLKNSGITRIVFCVSYKSQMIREYVEDGKRFGLEVEYSEDGETLLGTGGAIQKALPILENEFMVLYGDSYLPMNYEDANNEYKTCNKSAMMCVYRNENEFDQSNALFLPGGKFMYKKGASRGKYTHIDYGLSFYRKKLFMKNKGIDKFDLADFTHNLAANGELHGYEVFEKFYEIGSQLGLKDFESYILNLNNSKNK